MKKKTGQRNERAVIKHAVTVVLASVMAFSMVLGSFTPVTLAAEGSSEYFGTYTGQSTYNTEDPEIKDSYYFFDSWFEQDAEQRNDGLALVGMQLVAAAYNGDAKPDCTQFLEDLGFSDTAFADVAAGDPEACSYVHGKKTLADGRSLVAVVIQSYSLDSTVKEQGWKQNFMVNGEDVTSGEHYAFALAADKVIDGIKALGDENTVYWVMGQSRGGALTNLIAKRLGDAGRTVYAYAFESPALVDAEAVSGEYGYIHNYFSRDDIVTKIPFWGMTRYGNAYELKTDETDAQLLEQLTRLGSEAGSSYVPDSEETENRIVDYLASRVADRGAYSEVFTDVFTDPESGEEVSVSGSYQESFMNLISVVLRGELGDVSTYVFDHVGAVAPAVYDLVEAVKQDGTPEALPYYDRAAEKLYDFLDQASEGPLSLSPDDLYRILKLIGPFAVDTAYEPVDDPASDVMGYLGPVLIVALEAKAMTFSHHFDMVIGRLKTLAPAPVLEDIDITTQVPQAGDDREKIVSEVNAFFDDVLYKDAGENQWIAAEAEWDSEDQTLQQDNIYYLDITLESVGHTVPEDIAVTLNGKLPVKRPEISYNEGVEYIALTYEIEIGQAEEIEISFDTNGKTEAPQAIKVKRGTSLSTVEKPVITELVEADGAKYLLKGWFDAEGNPWEEVHVNEPMTMYADWFNYIDSIDISFVIPSLGDPVTEATVSEDALYLIEEQCVVDPDFEDAEAVVLPGQYYLNGVIVAKDPENSVFASGVDEWETTVYSGNFTINGQEYPEPDYEKQLYSGLVYGYDAEYGTIFFMFYFPVTEESPAEPVYTVSEGGEQVWSKGWEEGARFVVKRDEQDELTFDLFKELQIDGQVLAEDAYTVTKGSLVIDVKASYLETLEEGTHTLKAVFEDGEAEAAFTIDPAPVDVDTADVRDTGIWILLMAASFVSLLSVRKLRQS